MRNFLSNLYVKTLVTIPGIQIVLYGFSVLIPAFDLRNAIGLMLSVCYLLLVPIYLFYIHVKDRFETRKSLFLLNFLAIEVAVLIFPTFISVIAVGSHGKMHGFLDKSVDPESSIITDAIVSFHIYSMSIAGIGIQIMLFAKKVFKIGKVE